MVAIFDLDGTLALIDHRRHLVQKPEVCSCGPFKSPYVGAICDEREGCILMHKPDWDSFNAACVNDSPNQNVILMYQALLKLGFDIYIFSGRDAKYRKETLEWLRKHDVIIVPERLIMRPEADFTPDEELKLKWVNELIDWGTTTRAEIKFIFDDRQKVVNMWREQGFTCMQVSEGNF